MSPTIDITCPKCSSLMRLQRPQVTSQVQCPKCNRGITVRPNGSISTAAPKASFRRLPAKLIVRVARPEAPLPIPTMEDYEEPDEEAILAEQKRRERNAKLRRASRKRQSRVLVTSLFAAFLVAAAGFSFAYWDQIQEASENLFLGPDNYYGITEDASLTLKQLDRLVGSAHGSQSRKSAAPSVTAAIDQFQSLTDRAAALPSIPQSEFANTRNQIQASFSSMSYGSLQRGIRAAKRKRMHSNDELGVQLDDLQVAVDRFMATCNASWRPQPSPNSAAEKMEHELVGVMREVWVTLEEADSKRSFADSAALVVKADAYFKHVVSGNDQGTLFDRDSAYYETAAFFSTEIASRIRELRIEYGGPSDGAVFDEYVRTLRSTIAMSTAEAEIAASNFAQNSTEAIFGPQYVRIPSDDSDAVANSPLYRTSPGSASVRSGSQSSNTSMASSASSSSVAGGSTYGISNPTISNPSISNPSNSDPGWGDFVKSFKEKWAEEKTAVIWVRSAPSESDFNRAVSQLRKDLRPRGIRSKVAGDQAVVVLTYEDTMRSLAESLQWANDIATNEQDRSMTVKYQPFYN